MLRKLTDVAKPPPKENSGLRTQRVRFCFIIYTILAYLLVLHA